jgi:lipopolysaccharide transport system permease protein
VLQPLGLTILISVVFSKLMNADIVVYAPYILSGVITWEFIVASVTGGSLAFAQAAPYILQRKHPLAIYTLRTTLVSLSVLGIASASLYLWAAVVLPANIGWHWLATLTIFPILAALAWPLSTLLAYVGTRFRDVPHATGLVMQALWFASPVYFQVEMFRNAGLDALVDYNPIYHILEIFRAPLLAGTLPSKENYLFAFVTVVLLTVFAAIVGTKAEKKVIFYV